MRLAIFDLDNTLIAGDSDHGWGEFMVAQGMVDPVAYKKTNDGFYEDYIRGEMDLNAYLKFSLKPLTRYSLPKLDQLHQKFMTENVASMYLPKAKALLQEHRDQGDYLLIITSTNSFITKPIAKALGVDHILATDAEIVDERYTGNISGTPCYKEGKITRLDQWLAEAENFGFNGDLNDCYFYSDSINDLPLMAEVDNPVAVDADSKLTTEAKKRGWPIISLRD